MIYSQRKGVKKFRILMELIASALIPRVCLFVEEPWEPIVFKNIKNMKNMK